MGFEGSYLWRLRQKVGTDLVLVPGAEEGAGFAATAAAELREETGAVVAPEALRPFGCLSRPELHTIEHENGDVTHCFAMCFWAERWSGELRGDEEEVRELGFCPLEALPQPLHAPSAAGLELFAEHLRSGEFQAS